MRNNIPTAAVDRLASSLAVLATFGARKIDESRYAIDDFFWGRAGFFAVIEPCVGAPKFACRVRAESASCNGR